MPNPADGSVWGSVIPAIPGAVVRVAPGANPSDTALTEIYNVPLPGFGVRGADIDCKGVVWVSLASGHLGEFDRRKCKGPLNGPRATGDHCPEGWTFHRLPGPAFAGVPDQSVEFELLHLGRPARHARPGQGRAGGHRQPVRRPARPGRTARSSPCALPYPLGFYAKGLDGRIDDPSAGWKGRGLWTTSGDRTPWHMEGGKGTKPLAVHFQVRPNPLAS